METPIKKPQGRPKKAGPLKGAVSFRLSEEARRLLPVLAAESGLSQASVVEMALRDLAKARGVKLDAEAASST